MNTVTIATKEYRRLLGAKRAMGKPTGKKSHKNFSDVAFGVLKNSFGKAASATYITRLRKSWR